MKPERTKADKAAIRKIADEHEASVKSILNEEQFTKWKTHKEEKKAGMKKFRKQNHGNKQEEIIRVRFGKRGNAVEEAAFFFMRTRLSRCA